MKVSYLLSVLKCLTASGFIKEIPESGTVIHLHKMGKLVLHDIILQMRRKEHQVQTEADRSPTATTTPSGTTPMNTDITKA